MAIIGITVTIVTSCCEAWLSRGCFNYSWYNTCIICIICITCTGSHGQHMWLLWKRNAQKIVTTTNVNSYNNQQIALPCAQVQARWNKKEPSPKCWQHKIIQISLVHWSIRASFTGTKDNQLDLHIKHILTQVWYLMLDKQFIKRF